MGFAFVSSDGARVTQQPCIQMKLSLPMKGAAVFNPAHALDQEG